MLLVGVAFGLAIGWLFLDDDPPPPPPPPRNAQPTPVSVEAPSAPSAVPTQHVLAFFVADLYLYVSLEGAGVMRTKDGKEWEPLILGIPDPRRVQALAEVRPTRDTLAAKMLMPDGEPPDVEAMQKALMAVAQLKPGLVAGTSDGRVLRLDGDTWSEIARLPADNGGIHRLRYHAAVGLAAATGKGVFISPDGGTKWEPVTNDPLTRDVMLSLDPQHRYLVATFGNGLQTCDERGRCRAVKGSPKKVRRLEGDKEAVSGYALTDEEGLFAYDRDRGATPIEQTTLDYSEGWDLAMRAGRVVVAAGPSGLWMRDSAQSAWRLGHGLPPDSVEATAIFGGRVYAGTRSYGVLSADFRDFLFEVAP